jgi:hypothetical protein
MTEREVTRDVIGHTASTQPDVKIIVHPWYIMVLVRVARVYAQSLLGLYTADLTIHAIDTNLFITAAFPAFISLLQNTIEILNKLDTNEQYTSYRA